MRNERNFLMSINPKDRMTDRLQLTFVGDPTNELTTSMQLTNRSDSRLAFKIKCSRNELFRIRPATGVLDYNQSVDVAITFKPNKDYTPASDRHHFSVSHIPAPEGSTCTGAWAEHYGPPQGETRLKVFFGSS